MTTYDVIVIGGGHAGCEAALAAARLGMRTALLTQDAREIGRMPCNPAIGGLGKGQLVREIDALGGQMGLAIDATGIQFRILNRRKGPAVRSPRAQADKHAYQRFMAASAAAQPNLDVVAGEATGLLTQDGRVMGVRVEPGGEIHGRAVILATGTFLRGLMHVGERQRRGGREGAQSAEGLSADLQRHGFTLRRLKTGTPMRLRQGSIDFERLTPQAGDPDPLPFSFRTRAFAPRQVLCHVTYTNERTHRLIRENLHRSPLYAGAIEGRGPRYCPSIEDKVVRFADKDRHHLFLEPEGLDTDEIYVNGLSTSLPADLQVGMVRSIRGLEEAELARFGYAVEYDSVPSWQVTAALEAKTLAGLFLAGQILGTSGYEEAAAQGLIAGINACRAVRGEAPFVLDRWGSYIGVLIDDLVTKEISEPYRMFTARAERRLALRCDNAEVRMLGSAEKAGLLSPAELADRRAFAAEAARLGRGAGRALVAGRNRTEEAEAGQGDAGAAGLRSAGRGGRDSETRVPSERPETNKTEMHEMIASYRRVARPMSDEPDTSSRKEDAKPCTYEYNILIEQSYYKTNFSSLWLRRLHEMVEADTTYAGYIERQERWLAQQRHLDKLELPADLPYHTLTALSYEAREKLDRMRPATLGQAARIDGVRSADLAVLAVILRGRREGAARRNCVPSNGSGQPSNPTAPLTEDSGRPGPAMPSGAEIGPAREGAHESRR